MRTSSPSSKQLARKGKRIKQDWSPTFIEIKELHHTRTLLYDLSTSSTTTAVALRRGAFC